MNIVNPDYTVDRIVERMRQASSEPPSPSSASLGTSTIENGEPVYSSNVDIKPISFQPDFQTQDEYHVNDLLKFSDEVFIENAYRALLKRSADPAGRESLLAVLRNGSLNKVDVLARLRYSKEGRGEGVQVRGLFFPATLRTLYRVPLLGYLLNLSVAVVRLPSILKSHRQFEAHMLAHEEILVRHLNHVGQSLINQAHHVALTQEQLLNQLKVDNARIVAEQVNTHEVLLTRIGEFTAYLEGRINDEAAERQDELKEALEAQRKDVDRIADDVRSRLQQFGELIVAMRADLATQQQRERRTTAELSLQSQQLSRVLNRAPSEQPPQFSETREFDTRLLDAFFASFDEQFRGGREAIKERLKVYLSYLPVEDSAPVVDLGCGRGEWLELLKDMGLAATGVELNSLLVQACHERGLNVIEQDLFGYLGALPDASVGVVSAFHVVEHLSIKDLVSLLNETMRVLKPGGKLIIETPNPRNVLVGSCNFYFDPTHRNPLPSEVLELMVETRGFEAIEVLPLNPSNAMPVPGDAEIVQRFNQYFYGPMDYGLIARRP